MTRRDFIGGSAALMGAAVAGRAAVAQGASPYRAADYAALRKHLRAFYPPDGQGDEMTPQDPRALASYKRIEADLADWCAAHPGYDALDVRRECYLAMRKHFVPYLFTESPFYFEAGVNGGWGGRGRFVAELEAFFEKTPGNFIWNDYYNHPNEPVHHVPYLFSAVGRPDLTAKWTHRICRGAYHDDEDGLCGNDDVGQMSVWYVLSAIGMHPICPGDGRWYLTMPLFDETTIRLDPRYCSGRTFKIVAKRADSGSRTAFEARLNGRVLDRPFVTTAEVMSGGVLEITVENVK